MHMQQPYLQRTCMGLVFIRGSGPSFEKCLSYVRPRSDLLGSYLPKRSSPAICPILSESKKKALLYFNCFTCSEVQLIQLIEFQTNYCWIQYVHADIDDNLSREMGFLT